MPAPEPGQQGVGLLFRALAHAAGFALGFHDAPPVMWVKLAVSTPNTCGYYMFNIAHLARGCNKLKVRIVSAFKL
jgi:hypothetical protein